MPLIQDQIVAAAGAAGVDPSLALAVAQRESGFNQGARGAAGEIGIFQVKPSTAAGMGCDPYTVAGNIVCGVRYLAQMLAQFGGDPFKAVAAYNAGPGRVGGAIQSYGDQWFDHIPSSTQEYVLDVVPALAEPGGADPPPAEIFYAGLPGLPAIPGLPPHYETLAFGLALAGALLLSYSYAARDSGWGYYAD